MANFNIVSPRPPQIDVPEITNPLTKLAGFGRQALENRRFADADRVKRNRQKAQEILVKRFESDPEFAQKLSKGIGIGQLFPADPEGAMGLIKEQVKQTGQTERDAAKLAQRKADFQMSGNLLKQINAARPEMFKNMRPLVSRVFGRDIPNAEWDEMVQANKDGRKLVIQDVPGMGQVVTTGEGKSYKFTNPKPERPGSLTQQMIDARMAGDEEKANALLKVEQDISAANRDPNSAYSYATAYDEQGNPYMKAISKAGMQAKAGKAGNEGADSGMAPMEPPPMDELPSTGMPTPGALEIAPANASNSVDLGFDSLGTKPAKPGKPDEEPYTLKDRLVDVRKTFDQNKIPSMKALAKITDAQTNNVVMQEMDTEYQKAMQAGEPGAKNLYKMFGNIRGISGMFTFMRNLDDSVVRPTEQKMIQEALPWAADSNRLGRAFDDMRKWWNNEDSQLGPDAVAVLNTLSKNTLAFARARAIDDVKTYIAANVERGIPLKDMLDIATVRITDARVSDAIRSLGKEMESGISPQPAANEPASSLASGGFDLNNEDELYEYLKRGAPR